MNYDSPDVVPGPELVVAFPRKFMSIPVSANIAVQYGSYRSSGLRLIQQMTVALALDRGRSNRYWRSWEE